MAKISAIEIVREQNPWWEDRDAIYKDEYVRNLGNSKFAWIPRFLEDLEFEPAIYSLRGPRRIGKTTLLRYLIKLLINNDINPKDIVYISCDSLSSWTELRDILRFIVSDNKKKYIFIDEASFILEWARAIKYLYDLGRLKKCFVLITGSHAMDIVRGVERLPGRRGVGRDFVLLPATFGEYIRTLDPKLYERITYDEDPLFAMEAKRSQIYRLFEKYLYAGGFPKAQHLALDMGFVSHDFMMEFITYLKGDALRERLDVNVLLAVVRRILETLTVPVSWRSLANKTGYHHEKIRNHVEFLRFAFAVEYIYPPMITKSGLVPDMNRSRKIYPLDPFILYAFYSWVFGTQNYNKICLLYTSPSPRDRG